MKIHDLMSETYSALSGNKARSGLTMLGIVIGISSVIVLVGVGQGATASITSNLSNLGSNLLMISPGASRNAGPVSGGAGSATTLTQADAEAIKQNVSDVSVVVAELSKRYQVTYKGNNTNVSVVGTEPSYANIRNVSVDNGSFITDQQQKEYSKVAVIGPTVRDDLFGADVDPIGQVIKINKIQFKVVGLTVAKGGSGMSSSDNSIFVPLGSAQRFLAGRTSISEIDAQATSANTLSAAQQEVTDLLLSRHKISDSTLADFSVMNQADLVSSLSSVTTTLTILLGAIAGISLLVGGIGIMNMMLTTVTERTREIGLRKAIGAKSRDISMQFLTEAVMLTFIGGFIGIILGWTAAIIITKTGLVTSKVTWQSVVLAFSVSALVGIIFGYYPARRASSLKPIDALKYE
ncbi:MAG: ABC transporter permease [Candidatus Berkelbacteria bacterium]|nr:ABC transporter permease [Candidatus Berkelbacteria bacterium]